MVGREEEDGLRDPSMPPGRWEEEGPCHTHLWPNVTCHPKQLSAHVRILQDNELRVLTGRGALMVN